MEGRSIPSVDGRVLNNGGCGLGPFESAVRDLAHARRMGKYAPDDRADVSMADEPYDGDHRPVQRRTQLLTTSSLRTATVRIGIFDDVGRVVLLENPARLAEIRRKKPYAELHRRFGGGGVGDQPHDPLETPAKAAIGEGFEELFDETALIVIVESLREAVATYEDKIWTIRLFQIAVIPTRFQGKICPTHLFYGHVPDLTTLGCLRKEGVEKPDEKVVVCDPKELSLDPSHEQFYAAFASARERILGA